jgi:hypothetical protein
MADTRYHNLGEIGVKFGEFLFDEWAADGISWAPANDQISAEAGARGAVAVSEMFDEVSEITLNIVPTSPNNAIINATIGQFLPLVLTDLNSTNEILAVTGRIAARPEFAKPQEIQGASRVIRIMLFGADVDYGGGNVPV